MSWSVAGASLPGGGGGGVNPGRAPAGGGGSGLSSAPGSDPGRNMIITGTGPFASAGSTRVSGMSTVIAGNAALSACPVSCVPITRRPPIVPVSVAVTAHVTFGASFGTRPITSRSKSSTISARRRVQSRGVVTRCPFFSTSRGGRFGNGLAFASS
ncbi:MAG: hypothetical protein DMD35_22315 [Gemmatimonadetes bacterium]|nr:MAG: hypothetical protein DMD35_22315 [Gemmatimonadota bacterium]